MSETVENFVVYEITEFTWNFRLNKEKENQEDKNTEKISILIDLNNTFFDNSLLVYLMQWKLTGIEDLFTHPFKFLVVKYWLSTKH